MNKMQKSKNPKIAHSTMFTYGTYVIVFYDGFVYLTGEQQQIQERKKTTAKNTVFEVMYTWMDALVKKGKCQHMPSLYNLLKKFVFFSFSNILFLV